jgi:hypothetical protein
MNGFREGKKLPKKQINKRIIAFNTKVEEYNKLSLEELKELYPTLKGAYKFACEEVTMNKLNREREIYSEISSKELENKDNIKEQLDEE